MVLERCSEGCCLRGSGSEGVREMAPGHGRRAFGQGPGRGEGQWSVSWLGRGPRVTAGGLSARGPGEGKGSGL